MNEAESPSANDIRPQVAGGAANRGPWLFAAALAVGATVLFVALESRRVGQDQASAAYDNDTQAPQIAAPPALAVPAVPAEPVLLVPVAPRTPAPTLLAPPPPRERPRREMSFLDAMNNRPPPPQGGLPGIDAPMERVSRPPAAPGRGSEAGKPGERVSASRFENPATSVPKGTIIQAVLETALDSTRPGYARAIISRDIHGFDGSRVLIPRGSRLIGEYKADLAAGQKRALIQWTRLMRPDGVMINLDSPAADPLGRAGVEGKVNSHFFERFGGAILQSALNLGTQVAVNKVADGTVLLAVPLTGPVVPSVTAEKVQPTLTVRQGTSVSVFVARDLDFTAFEQ